MPSSCRAKKSLGVWSFMKWHWQACHFLHRNKLVRVNYFSKPIKMVFLSIVLPLSILYVVCLNPQNHSFKHSDSTAGLWVSHCCTANGYPHSCNCRRNHEKHSSSCQTPVNHCVSGSFWSQFLHPTSSISGAACSRRREWHSSLTSCSIGSFTLKLQLESSTAK